MTNLHLKDLTSKSIVALTGEADLHHGYAHIGWIKTISEGDFIAEVSSYHGDKNRGNYYSEHYETTLKIKKQSKAKTTKEIKDFFNGQVSKANGKECLWY